MQKRTVISLLATGVFLFVLTPPAQAQAAQSSAKPPSSKQVVPYRLDFSINELEGGKMINTRRYSMNLTDDSGGGDLKIGSRVPVGTEEGKIQYVDVGTSIYAHFATWLTPVTLFVHAEISSFATPDDAKQDSHPPLLRQMRISGSTVLIAGKPMIVGTVDDPNSNRSFQLVVTATKLD